MPTYLITGATGKQGSSIIHTLLSSSILDLKIHAFVRDPSSPASQALQSLGAILVPGTFSSLPSLTHAAQNCDAVFLNTVPVLSTPGTELQHAQNVILAAKQAGV
jgi:uncharacterized protein YbjT (DUF2867 family)